MKHILIIGAGHSSAALIAYLNRESSKNQWEVIVADAMPDTVQHYANIYTYVRALQLDIFNVPAREQFIQQADLVISMLPAHFHIHVAVSCLKFNKPMITASYIDQEVKKLSRQIEDKNLTFLFECGLDPGIDHMSAMQAIDHIQERGGRITSFQSFCGGLMAPGSDDNPWRYKFTWNPRNVVLAGTGGAARYIYKGRYQHIPYHQLFKRLTMVEIPGLGAFESYPNRDSLQYRDLYGLYDASTILRGTLRRPGYCAAWHTFVQLGLTDDTYQVHNVENMTYADFLKTYLPYSEDDLSTNFCRYTNTDISSEIMHKVRWLGIMEERPIGLQQATPAQVMQKLLEEKWKTRPGDKDMIVMQHQMEYELQGERKSKKKYISSLAVTGELSGLTAMSMTVGYPLGIAAKLILENKISQKGLMIPVHRAIYQPVLEELAQMGIQFTESVEDKDTTTITHL